MSAGSLETEALLKHRSFVMRRIDLIWAKVQLAFIMAWELIVAGIALLFDKLALIFAGFCVLVAILIVSIFSSE